MLKSILTFSLNQRIFILFFAILITSLGIYSAATITTDAFPDVTGTQVDIIARLPGKSPMEIEKFVTTPLELAMRGLPGLKSMRSVSRFGITVVTVIFEDKTDIYFARSQVLERLIEAKEGLPEGAEAILGPISTAMGEIYRYTIDDSAKRVSANEEDRLTLLRTLQDWVIAPYLKNVPGVNEIDPFGGYIKEYQVIIYPDRLLKYGLTLKEVFDVIGRNNSNVGGSFLERGAERLIVRGVGLFKSTRDIEDVALKSESGASVFLKDVAKVVEGRAIRQGAAIMDGRQEAVGATVLMLKGCNSRQVVKDVKKRVREINESGLLPEGVTLKPAYDRTDVIREASHTLGKALGEGIILILLIIYFFLRSPRGAWVIISALLLSILLTAVIMKLTSMTANLMTLGGIIISLGMIIDSAIIQAENVQRHLTLTPPSEPGRKLQVILDAVMEVRKPSILGELIIAITFLPILALEGMEGKMFSPLAISVFIALMASLFLSVSVIPVLCFYLLKPKEDHGNRILDSIKRFYARALNWSLKKPRAIIMSAVIILVAGLAIVPLLGTEFLPVMDEGAFDMDSVMLPGVSLTKSIEINKKIQEIVMTFPEMKSVFTKIGLSGIGFEAKDIDSGTTTGTLQPRRFWKTAKTRGELVDKMRDALAVIPGVVVSFSQPIQCRIDELVAGTKSQVVIKLFGDDMEILKSKADDIARTLSRVKGTEDIMVEQVAGQQYIEIAANRQKIAQYGINVGDVQDLIETAMGGKTASVFFEGNRYFNIVVRYDESSRKTIDSIGNLIVETGRSGARLPLRELADITVAEGPVMVGHEAGQRKILIQCNVHGRDLGGAVAEAQKRIKKDVAMPTGYFIEWGGQFENQQKAFRKLGVIVPVAILVIFLLLFATFNSVPLAVLVILTLPLALAGGVFALLVSGSYLSVPASIGFIALFGIAVLNGVVLVSYIAQLREEGMGLEDAITQGCETRLRPILMTASIAIFSLIPLLFSSGPGSEVQKPLAIVVVGGLITSTLMTVIVLPVLYRYFMGKELRDEEERGRQTFSLP
jgi:heavy metal efflux system protein